MRFRLIGAGGHGRAVMNSLADLGWQPVAYADPRPAAWLGDLPRTEDAGVDTGPQSLPLVIGLGGVTPQALASRLKFARRLVASGATLPAAVNPRARVSASAVLDDAVVVMPGAMLGAGVRIGFAAIVNTGAIVEHEAEIGAGAHLAPGSIVLGGARIGEAAMVGAGAIILPGSRVEPASLVAAGKRA